MPSVETLEAPPLPVSAPVSSGLERALAEAERFGRLEAEAYEAGLRAIERRERELLMGRSALASDLFAADPDGVPVTSTTELLRLRREVDRLADFHRTLLHSRSWRLLQALKRPFGRAW